MSNNNSLHPEILFHFTNIDALYGILKETFKVYYSLEKISGKSKPLEFGVPMVSFCDLKLSELKTHMENYGNYGIGLTKEWAFRSNLNPVFYVNEKSLVINKYISGVNKLYAETKRDGLNDDHFFSLLESYDSTLGMYRFIKNYQGKLKRKNKPIINNFRFADEREWRYVPDTPGLEFPFAPKEFFDTEEKKAELNLKVSHLKLSFQADDIKYLIVEHDSEIDDLISHLDNAKVHYDNKTKRRLASRILTAEQIHNDV